MIGDWRIESAVSPHVGWIERGSATTKKLAIEAMRELRRQQRPEQQWRVVRIVDQKEPLW